MAIINQSNILNLQPGITAPVVVHMSEGDSGTKLSFTIMDGMKSWTDPGNVVAAVHGIRQDGTQFGPIACSISGNVISFQANAAMSGVAGTGIAEIVLTDSFGNTAGSANFAIMVERATFPVGVTYANDASVYEAILTYVQTIPAQVTEDYTAMVANEAAMREVADAALMQRSNELQSQLSAEITNRTDQEAVLSARMDEFTKLPDGSLSTAADAELVDVRVMINGETAEAAGDAVRKQFNDIKKEVDHIGDNLIADGYASYSGLYINTQYNRVSTSSGTALIVIPCQPDTRYTIWKPTATVMRVAGSSNSTPVNGDSLNVLGYHASASSDPINVRTGTTDTYMYVQLWANNDAESLRSISANILSLVITTYKYSDEEIVEMIPERIAAGAFMDSLSLVDGLTSNFEFVKNEIRINRSSGTSYLNTNVTGSIHVEREGSLQNFEVYDEDFISSSVITAAANKCTFFATTNKPAVDQAFLFIGKSIVNDEPVYSRLAFGGKITKGFVVIELTGDYDLSQYDEFAIYIKTEKPITGLEITWTIEPHSDEIADLKALIETAVLATDVFNAEPYTGEYDWQTPVASYGGLFNNKANVEAFAFFTDPHVLGFGDDNWNEERMHNYLKRVQKTYNATPCGFIVCGGDWLNNSTTMAEACYRLGLMKGAAKHLLDGCYLVIGNHDTNYQGKLDANSENGTGRIADATLAAIMYSDTETKKAYYSFDGARSKCYVLDSGIEHSDMTEYDWEQVAWLAEKLRTDDAEHSIIFLHIIRNSGTTQKNAQNFGNLVAAYNEHTTVTLNDVTYDFTGCTGKVMFWAAGHTHVDSTGTLGGIPYFITASNSYSSDVPLIDLALVDYDNDTLNLIRVGGTGDDRTISI